MNSSTAALLHCTVYVLHTLVALLCFAALSALLIRHFSLWPLFFSPNLVSTYLSLVVSVTTEFRYL